MIIAEKILFNVVAFFLFIFLFIKMIYKNDTNYIGMLAIQAIGISINFIEILTGLYANTIVRILMYLSAIVIPIIVMILENRGHNFSEKISKSKAKFYLIFNDNKDATSELINLVSKYPESYIGHKMLAEIYEKEGRYQKSNRRIC